MLQTLCCSRISRAKFSASTRIKVSSARSDSKIKTRKTDARSQSHREQNSEAYDGELTKSGRYAQNARSGCAVFEKLSERTDCLHLLFPQSAQILLAESIFVQESPQHIRKSRTAKVVFASNFSTALG
jgi:hypothetical protein